MLSHGVCCDALNPFGRPSVTSLKELGVGLVRLVGRKNRAFAEYHNRIQRSGIRTAVVLARESFSSGNYVVDAQWYGQHVQPNYWVIGNEPDADPESESSWIMSPSIYQSLWVNVEPYLRAGKRVMAGQVSGGTDWLRRAGRLSSYVDIHPYAKTAEEARILIKETRAVWDQTPLVLEWNRPPNEMIVFSEMLLTETEASAWYCWSDEMTQYMGLIAGTKKQREYWALKAGLWE